MNGVFIYRKKVWKVKCQVLTLVLSRRIMDNLKNLLFV